MAGCARGVSQRDATSDTRHVRERRIARHIANVLSAQHIATLGRSNGEPRDRHRVDERARDAPPLGAGLFPLLLRLRIVERPPRSDRAPPHPSARWTSTPRSARTSTGEA